MRESDKVKLAKEILKQQGYNDAEIAEILKVTHFQSTATNESAPLAQDNNNASQD